MYPRWNELELDLVTILKDEIPAGSDRSRRYAPLDLIRWWNYAQIRLATMKPLQRHQEYKGDSFAVNLPENFYKATVLVLPDGSTLPKMSRTTWFTQPQKNGYIVYEGQITVRGAIKDHFMLLYDAYYPKVETVDSFIKVPEWAIEACMLHVASLALVREVISDARYRKFISKQDAGNPEQIPFLPAARFLIERFNEIVKSHIDDDDDFRSAKNGN